MSVTISTSWTDERVQEVTRLLAAKCSASEIAKQMGVTRNAIIGIAHRRGLTFARRVGAHDLPGTPRRHRAYKPRRKIQPIDLPPQIPALLPDLRQADVEPRYVLLDDLGHDECRYPFGELAPFTFCARPVHDGCYCPAHFLLTHNFDPRRRVRGRRISKYGSLVALEVVA